MQLMCCKLFISCCLLKTGGILKHLETIGQIPPGQIPRICLDPPEYDWVLCQKVVYAMLASGYEKASMHFWYWLVVAHNQTRLETTRDSRRRPSLFSGCFHAWDLPSFLGKCLLFRPPANSSGLTQQHVRLLPRCHLCGPQ